MRARALFVLVPLAILGIALALMIDRAPPQSARTEAPPPPVAVEEPSRPPPEGFAETYALEREETLMREAREAALASARAEERERFEDLKRAQIAAARSSLPSAQLTEQRAQRFEAESVDREWAPGAEREILEKISQTAVKALDVRVECRTTVCRLELLQRASDPPVSFEVAVALRQAANLQASPPKEGDAPAGTRSMVSYVVRR